MPIIEVDMFASPVTNTSDNASIRTADSDTTLVDEKAVDITAPELKLAEEGKSTFTSEVTTIEGPKVKKNFLDWLNDKGQNST
jgi:hypothetical protein